jgi:hypothetical protein
MSTGKVVFAILLAAIGTFGLGCGGSQETATAGAELTTREDSIRAAALTEVWEPVPAVVSPGATGAPPSDAIVLFDGNDLSEWAAEEGGDAGWSVEDGAMTVVPASGSIVTRRGFGDIQLHIEWRSPAEVRGESQGRGNSGVYFMELYEIQVLDSYENSTYPNGQAGAIYKQHIPMVNASRGPGEWQSYDVIFTAPRFDADGSLSSPAYMTAFHNGVLIQNHAELRGPTEWIGEPEYEAHADRAPILIQDHGNPVSYRNIWVREISGLP